MTTIAIVGGTVEAKTLHDLCISRGVKTIILSGAGKPEVGSLGATDLAGCGILLDARGDAASDRADQLRQAEATLPATAMVATVARHRRLGSLSKSLARPANFAGLCLSGTSDRAVIEVIRAPKTSDETVARFVELAGHLGGKVLVVQDSPGFFSTRISQIYFNEAMAMVGEGVPAAQVEHAAVESGLESGPLALLDRVSLELSDDLLHQELHDLEHEAAHADDSTHDHDSHGHGDNHDHGHGHDDHGHGHAHDHAHGHGHAHDHDHAKNHAHNHGTDHSHAATATAHGHKHSHKVKSKRMPEAAVYVMEKMAHGFRRMGREAGAGFYEYEDDGTASLWSGLKSFERRTTKLPAQDLRDRLLFIQALETIRCIDEGVIGSLADADAVLVHLGIFPAGGPKEFVNRMGSVAFVTRAQALATSYGERFQPPARLVDLANRNQPLKEQTASGTASH